MAILYLATGLTFWAKISMKNFCESLTKVKPGSTFHGLQWGFTEFFLPSFLH